MTEEETRPSPETIELVRDALAHLYEPAYLVRHPLVGLLEDVLPPLGDRAQSLRLFLLDAIERIQPSGMEHLSEKARRPYTVLVQRYVVGLAVNEIIVGLHIGPRQFRREHQKGLEALAAHLWPYCRDRRLSVQDTASSHLISELEVMGVSSSSVSLPELIEAMSASGETLARHHGAALSIAPAPAVSPRCRCDLTLAKQSGLLALGSLLVHRPRYIHLTVSHSTVDPSILLTALPPLPPEAAARIDSELVEARLLMAAQGGTVGLLKKPDGSIQGLRLQFRPDNAAMVLVVDDNERMLRLYERYLMVGHYGIRCANSAQEAEAVLDEVTPNAIVLDVMMRNVDGWDLLQRLRSRPGLRAVPILVVSILNEPSMAQALGAAAYLRKPVTAQALLTALGQVLGGSSQGEQYPEAP